MFPDDKLKKQRIGFKCCPLTSFPVTAFSKTLRMKSVITENMSRKMGLGGLKSGRYIERCRLQAL